MTEVYFSKTWPILGYHDTLNKHGDLSFFPHIFDLPFILFLFKGLEKKTHVQKKTITRNALLMEMKS